MEDKYLWIAVTADEYELPIAVETSAKKLGDLLGMSKKAVMNAADRHYNGQETGRRFYKIKEE